ncbi:MAG: hypothetical protein QXN55_01565 [Candidatus Nitrosotenuis sp.]
MSIDQGKYFFKVKVALSSDDFKNHTLTQFFPDGQEAELESIIFNNYKDCADTISGIIQDIAVELNSKGTDTFSITWEANPKFDKKGKAKNNSIRSMPWRENELLRMYIINVSAFKNRSVISNAIGSVFNSS